MPDVDLFLVALLVLCAWVIWNTYQGPKGLEGEHIINRFLG